MANLPEPLVLKHEILVLDAVLKKELDPKSRKQDCVRLIKHLLRSLKMEELGPLQFYDAADLRAPGWSFIQPITTSHISGHYFEKPGDAPHIHIDIYSCDSVDYQIVINILNDHLDLAEWSADFIERNTESSSRNVVRIVGNGSRILSCDDVRKLGTTSSAQRAPALSLGSQRRT